MDLKPHEVERFDLERVKTSTRKLFDDRYVWDVTSLSGDTRITSHISFKSNQGALSSLNEFINEKGY